MVSPESLPSEDWISQPRSSAPASINDGSSGIINSGNASISRIPRPISCISRTASESSVSRNDPLTSSPLGSRSHSGEILNERTASALNISHTRNTLKSAKTGKQDTRPRGSGETSVEVRHSSLRSPGPEQQGTVQQKAQKLASGGKARSQDVPEWQRRVINGGIKNQQQDLFSPMELEHVFRPLSTGQPTKEKSPKSKTDRFAVTETGNFPSSPPPFSVSLRLEDTAMSHNSLVRQMTTSISPMHENAEDAPLPVYRVTSNVETTDISPRPIAAPHSRIQSSRSEAQHESISPVPFAGVRINSESLDSLTLPQRESPKAFTYKSKIRAMSRSSDNDVDYRSPSFTQSQEKNEEETNWTVQSLPEILSAGTEVLAPVSDFVAIRRGGYSIDDSFQRRPLSPSSFQQSHASSLDTNTGPKTHLAKLRTPVDEMFEGHIHSDTPNTPSRDVNKSNTPERPRSSGSPLKLFDKHDTFTNDRLARRMSQFEGVAASTRSGSNLEDCSLLYSPSPRKRRQAKKHQNDLDLSTRYRTARTGSFGNGSLSRHHFQHLVTSEYLRNDGDRKNFIPLPKARPGATHARRYSSRSKGSVHGGRTFSYGSCGESPNDYDPLDATRLESITVQQKRLLSLPSLSSQKLQGKRCRRSPVRYPTPKRRRTVYSTVEVPTHSVSEESRSLAPPCQSIVSRKRKDARYEEHAQIVDPQVMATRHILRPRNSTTSQARAPQTELSKPAEGRGFSGIGEGALLGDRQQNLPLEPTAPLEEAPIKVLAGELANFALGVAQDITYGDRKVSVTTADFTNAANLIMQNIRAQARPECRTSLPNSREGGHLGAIEEFNDEGSTAEALSRPPSRIGRDLCDRRDPKQLDPRIISHLRKYEEKHDMCISPSSLSLFGASENHVTPPALFQDSSPPNIRLLGRKESETNSSADSITSGSSDAKERCGHSHNSLPSSNAWSERSLPTGSSNHSANKAIIAPERVSHLIADQVAGMTFDRSRQAWIKKKPTAQDNHGNDPIRLDSDATEEDPLKGIPDLSVDEMEEMRRVNGAATVLWPSSSENCTEQPAGEKAAACAQAGSAVQSVMPTTHGHESPTPHFESLIPPSISKVDPVDDGYVEVECQVKTLQTDGPLIHPSFALQSKIGESLPRLDPEAHFSNIQPKSTPTVLSSRARQPRVVTVAFSSPLVNHESDLSCHPRLQEDDVGAAHGDLDLTSSPEHRDPERNYKAYKEASQKSRKRSAVHSQRRLSVGNQNYLIRSISRIDEHEELSIIDYPAEKRGTRLAAMLPTPQTSRNASEKVSMPPYTTSRQSDFMFQLSPLSDFTLNHNDEPSALEVRCIVNRQGFLSSQELEDRFSLAIRKLTAKITDVEPYEPYWEHLRKLDLRNKDLGTLYMLENFCQRIEELDVSRNELGQLHGVPATVRVLRARRNRFSSITAWGHLQNLQYLDVSGNQLETLKGIGCLLHLRELKADDNQICNLDGIEGLTGLIKLRLRGNSLTKVDLEALDM